MLYSLASTKSMDGKKESRKFDHKKVGKLIAFALNASQVKYHVIVLQNSKEKYGGPVLKKYL